MIVNANSVGSTHLNFEATGLKKIANASESIIQVAEQALAVRQTPRKSLCDRIKEIPVIGHIIRAIIWLFKKIFPCCFSKEKPQPIILTSIIKNAANIATTKASAVIVPIAPMAVAKPTPPPVKIIPVNLDKILNLTAPLKSIVVEGLPKRDLEALNTALYSRKSSDLSWKQLQESVKKGIEKRVLQEALDEILVDHPTWKAAVDGWNKVSLQNKVWLLRLYELHQLKPPTDANVFKPITLPHISAFFPAGSDKLTHNPSDRTPELLNSRAEIENLLAQVESLKLTNNGWGEGLKKFPNAICLLPNLKYLSLDANPIETPPDVSKNTKLIMLNLTGTHLKTSPDVSQNKDLQILYLQGNFLSIAPNLTPNTQLRFLDLANNHLTTPPDVRKNLNLEVLMLTGNAALSVAPDLSQNVKLGRLMLGGTSISSQEEFELIKISNKRPRSDLAWMLQYLSA